MLGTMSLWTKPMKTGFTHEFMCCWALALGSARKHFEQVLLVTDSEGAKLLEGFPYDTVRTDLDKQPVPDTALKVWAAGKFIAYRAMCNLADEVCHFDGDVFMRKRPFVFGADLFAQCDEPFKVKGAEGSDTLNEFLLGTYFHSGCQAIPILPGHMRFSLTRNEQVAYNVGIVGGRDVAFIWSWAEEALYILNHPKNQNAISKLWGGSASCFIEQYLFASKARHENKYVSILFPQSARGNESFMDQIGYVHLLGGNNKRNPVLIAGVEQILRKYYPYLWDLVLSLKLPSSPAPQNPPTRSSQYPPECEEKDYPSGLSAEGAAQLLSDSFQP